MGADPSPQDKKSTGQEVCANQGQSLPLGRIWVPGIQNSLPKYPILFQGFMSLFSICPAYGELT